MGIFGEPRKIYTREFMKNKLIELDKNLKEAEKHREDEVKKGVDNRARRRLNSHVRIAKLCKEDFVKLYLLKEFTCLKCHFVCKYDNGGSPYSCVCGHKKFKEVILEEWGKNE